ncbi:MAG: Xcc1710-like domain-containing protein [Limnobacter sp.]|nr:Xcc1710-like domain-containing protein [Limnobacter sp.]
MKFQAEPVQGELVVHGYDNTGVLVNGQKHESSVVFGHNQPVTPWNAQAGSPLELVHVERLHALCPPHTEVLIVGTGVKQAFPGLPVRRFFAQKNCPVEFMDTQAACRTYNILIAEGRQVVVALVI